MKTTSQIISELRAGPNSGDPVFEEAADKIEQLETDAELLRNALRQLLRYSYKEDHPTVSKKAMDVLIATRPRNASNN